MLTYAPPWKMAVVGMVAVLAGVALLLVDWQLPELAKFVAMLFVARGGLHIVTTQFEGVEGGLSGAMAGGEVAVGIVLLGWPSPTLPVLALVVGGLVVLRGLIAAAIAVATREPHNHWKIRVGECVLEVVLGVTLIARPGGTVRGTAVTIGALAILAGVSEVVGAAGRMRATHAARQTGGERAVAFASPVA